MRHHQSQKPDAIMHATFISVAAQNRNPFTEMFWDLVRNIRSMIHIRRNMKAATARVAELEARMNRLQQVIDADYSRESVGNRINKIR